MLEIEEVQEEEKGDENGVERRERKRMRIC